MPPSGLALVKFAAISIQLMEPHYSKSSVASSPKCQIKCQKMLFLRKSCTANRSNSQHVLCSRRHDVSIISFCASQLQLLRRRVNPHINSLNFASFIFPGFLNCTAILSGFYFFPLMFVFLDHHHISVCWLQTVHFLAVEFAFPTLWWWIIKQNHCCVKVNLHKSDGSIDHGQSLKTFAMCLIQI